jgi:replicative DNA helicase
VLGGIMLDNSAWDAVADQLTEEDFYRREHRLIFRAVVNLAAKAQPFDAITISDWLTANNLLDQAGDLAYIGRLASDTPSAAAVAAYADIVRQRSVRRSLIAVGTDISNSAFNTEGRDTRELLDDAERQVFEIADQGSRGKTGFRGIRELLGKAIDRIDDLFQRDEPITGLPTGYTDFDEMTSGLQPSDLIIVAGRPSMGKTTFAVNIAESAAIKIKQPVAIFSMEMPAEQLAMRMMASLGRIDSHRMRTGKLLDDDWPRITSAVSILSEAKLFIDDTAALTPTELRARCRRLVREHGDLGLVVIDYLQLMQGSTKSDNRTNEISEISRSLKALAKEMKVPVMCLSQLNRSLEQRPNKRPIMSDLRESGAIEQDADVIVFIYRDEVYNEDSAEKGVAEIIIGKQRNGPIGTVRLTFLGQFTRFENYTAPAFAEEEFG